MTPKQRAKKTAYAREWYANLTPEQRDVKRWLAIQIGVSTREVPVELLETKVAVLNVKRKVRELMK